MEYRLELSSKSIKELFRFENTVRVRIIKKLRFFCDSGDPLSFAKSLHGKMLDAYRFRIGDYRVIFDLDNRGKITVLMVLKIGHRKEIYE